MVNYITEEKWQKINALGYSVEEKLQGFGVGLMMGGEPTFVSIDDFESPQWRTAALGTEKRQIAAQLLKRLAQRFQGGGILHYGLGKLYPGELCPRWALGYFWRKDGIPIWRNPELMAEDGKDYGHTLKDATHFIYTLVKHLGVNESCIIPAYETANDELIGYVLPLLSVSKYGGLRWTSCPWILPEDRLYTLDGESSLGLRLPLNAIKWAELEPEATESINANQTVLYLDPLQSPDNSIGTALTIEATSGTIHLFIPPMASSRSFLDLITAIEDTAAQIGLPVILEGYAPPNNGGIQGFQITPDPGVIEVNIHPASNWDELVYITTILDEEANYCRLGREKYLLDGRRVSTGGGAHITIGGKTPQESPLLRRPDLLCSFIGYWNNHPSLSYLFSGLFVGPTSQAPRVDEARYESLDELEIAFGILQRVDPPQPPLKRGENMGKTPPELIDRLLSSLLVDVTGNTHRAAFCIDKLYPINNYRSQLGLLEFRAVAMPPDHRLRLLQMLLFRACVAWFWEIPYTEKLIRWGTSLHDRFMLPYYLKEDLNRVLSNLAKAGYDFDMDWFEPFFEFRFPCYGEVILDELQLELRAAIEPWPVVGDAINSGGTSRLVDDTMERIQVTLKGVKEAFSSRYTVTCNGYSIPLNKSVVSGAYIGGVRFRARQYGNILHSALEPHTPLVFKIVDLDEGRSLGGCTYYVNCPNGNFYEKLPQNHQEAELRMRERFIPFESQSEGVKVLPLDINGHCPLTLDLRRARLSEN